MRQFFIYSLLFFISYSLSAQYKEVADTEKQVIIQKITQAAAEMKTMKCDFVQTKELSFMNDNVVSEGKMFYKSSNKIRWEYVKPYQYVFSMDGENVNISSGDKTNKIPLKASKIFSEISRVMIGGISGSGLVDSKDFTSRLMAGTADYKIILTPLKKEIKDMFSEIQLFVNKSNSRVKSVIMVEKSGDKTTVDLKNIQVNTAINDEIFSN
ncbi:MAG: outer membrane lipoprotein carrier protein LolA [Tannerella sp.]|jgi:outer membrane lipoprotein-sorting protein|nr:outer membrane lipoprotein carrier protein LolA [Tannerella sp.]